MAVAKIEGGKVVQLWRDVKSRDELARKYGLSGAEFVEADQPPGTLFDGANFTAPPPGPGPEPDPIPDALDALAAELSPEARGRVRKKLAKVRRARK